MQLLDTKEKRLAFRHIPTNQSNDVYDKTVTATYDDGHSIVYAYEVLNKLTARETVYYALAYRGTAGKAAFHYRYNTAEARDKAIAAWRHSRAQIAERAAERRRARTEFQHDLKVGEILDSMWGYEQTNVDFYEVVEVRGKNVVLREVAQKRTPTEYLQGTAVPVPGKYIGEPFTKRVSMGNWINLTSYSGASRWDGHPVHWTAYA